MDYLKLLEHSYEVEKSGIGCQPESRLDFLGDSIFGFTTCDGEMSALFAQKAVEVCAAINDRTTFAYIRDTDNYRWFLLMCNMPFFAGRLEWGASIRGAWWGTMHGKPIEFQSCGLWRGNEQLHQTMKFSCEEWEKLIAAVIAFAEPEMKSNARVDRTDAALSRQVRSDDGLCGCAQEGE